ncbi:MAG: protein translocase subunit SecD [Candidatus Omnitrophica bacterium]|nr:protein translocase subunit SecD [Candidatus Omnitrophota bacterium]
MRSLKLRIGFFIFIIVLFIIGAYPPQKKISLGLDLQGGMHLVLHIDTSALPDEAKKDAADRALEIIRNRIDQFGVKEPQIQKQGIDKIIVQLPGVTDRERAKDIVGKAAHLEFKLVSDDTKLLEEAQAGNVPEGYELNKAAEEPLLLEKETSVTGDMLVDAQVGLDPSRFNEPIVQLQFNDKGGRRFAKVTGENVGRRLAIVLDGKVHSAPVINERIPNGRAMISGRFSQEQAKDLAIVLRAGALPCPVRLEEERTIGPLLGQDSIRDGLKATAIGAIVVVIFMAVYYLLAGWVANLALILNFIIMMGTLGLLNMFTFGTFKATLTLPGIAGIVLSLGMAVDANVLIYERIREELSSGKTIRLAIDNGYKKAFLAILDSNVTTIIAAAILFYFGTGPIRGFAITLIIGLLASMYTAIVVTRIIFDILCQNKNFTTLKMLRLIRTTRIDFIKRRHIAYTFSLIIILGGLSLFYFKSNSAKYGIDFTGGTVQQLGFKNPIDIDNVRNALKEIGLADASIQQFKETKEIIIRTSKDESKAITDKFKEKFSDNPFELLRVETVGPVAGKELKQKAIWALLWALVAITVYVGRRFRKFSYGVAGVVALFHDVFLTVGAFAITGRQIDLLIVTALLTIAGYSINDTIVIYDRIRENLHTMRKVSFSDIINLSVNQTMARTLLTSLTILMTVVALYMFGGEVLNNFAFALLVGFISGVYSTVYIASPLLIAWERKKI